MKNEFKEKYKSLSRDQKSDFLLWATERYKMKSTSVRIHWIYGGAVPDNKKEEVLKKLEEIGK